MLQDRVPGEAHILGVDEQTASRGFCCPVGKPDTGAGQDRSKYQFEIKQLSAGIYNVTIPAFLYPGGVGSPGGGSGVCDAATNARNNSLMMGIERSTDPTGFTPAKALSITSCIDMRGPCAGVPRISIRESCKILAESAAAVRAALARTRVHHVGARAYSMRMLYFGAGKQLVWSTGAITSRLPVGQTFEVHEWVSNLKCDRRLRCVGGPCMWTNLAEETHDRTPENYGDPVFQLCWEIQRQATTTPLMEALRPGTGSQSGVFSGENIAPGH